MVTGDNALEVLREALRISPQNLPLRQHLADTLLSLGRADEAEREYRQALTCSPDNERIKLGLADSFFQQGKSSQALVIIEDLLKHSSPGPQVYLLHARLLLETGELGRAG